MAQTARLDIDKEIKRRKAAIHDLQIKMDQEELARREADVEAGRARLIDSDEFWDNVKKAGF
jgi:hypothetical protein